MLLACLFCGLWVNAQQKRSVITLKNGTVVTGVVTAINPLESVTVEIAGIITVIPMSEVSKIEESAEGSTSQESPETQDPFKNPNLISADDEEKLRVLDKAEYPESFELNVCGQTIRMILVRGGKLYMGYDGPNSLQMKSEPMHNVLVTSFYMSDSPISGTLYSLLTGKEVPERKKEKAYESKHWEDFDQTMVLISEKCGILCRQPTEAEWEFAACSESCNRIFSENSSHWFEYCSDWYAPFSQGIITVDPMGPATSTVRDYKVVRQNFKTQKMIINMNFKKFMRNPWMSRIAASRIVIKAKDYMEYLDKK